MKIRGDEPFFGLKSLVKMSEIHETGGVTQNLTMNDIWLSKFKYFCLVTILDMSLIS
jgi:hypothetical protein